MLAVLTSLSTANKHFNILYILYIFVVFKPLACHSGEGGWCNRLALLLLRTAHATYLLTLPPEVPPIPSISCVQILVAVLSLSTCCQLVYIFELLALER